MGQRRLDHLARVVRLSAAQSRKLERKPCGTAAMSRSLSSPDGAMFLSRLARAPSGMAYPAYPPRRRRRRVPDGPEHVDDIGARHLGHRLLAEAGEPWSKVETARELGAPRPARRRTGARCLSRISSSWREAAAERGQGGPLRRHRRRAAQGVAVPRVRRGLAAVRCSLQPPSRNRQRSSTEPELARKAGQSDRG